MKRSRPIPAPRAPAEIEHLTSVIGEAAALLLIEQYGGSRVSIPRVVTEASPIAGAVGLPAAQKLAEAFPAALLSIPACKAWRVRLYASRGWTASRIALKVGWDETTIYRHLRNHHAPSRHHQMDLFL